MQSLYNKTIIKQHHIKTIRPNKPTTKTLNIANCKTYSVIWWQIFNSQQILN